MIIKYHGPGENGQFGYLTIEFDKNGRGTIIRADTPYLREAAETALRTPIKCEISEYRNGALATGPAIAQPGTPLHAMAMGGALLEKHIQAIAIEGETFKV